MICTKKAYKVNNNLANMQVFIQKSCTNNKLVQPIQKIRM